MFMKPEEKSKISSGDYWAFTWSWASRGVQVGFLIVKNSNQKHIMTYIQARIDTTNKHHYGAVENAKLWVERRVFLHVEILSANRSSRYHQIDKATVPMIITWDHNENLSSQYYILPVVQDKDLGAIQGLIFMAGQAIGQYYRVGHFIALLKAGHMRD